MNGGISASNRDECAENHCEDVKAADGHLGLASAAMLPVHVQTHEGRDDQLEIRSLLVSTKHDEHESIINNKRRRSIDLRKSGHSRESR